MKRIILACLLISSCAKEAVIEEFIISTSSATTDTDYLSNNIGEIVHNNFIDLDITSSLEFQLVNDINVQDYNNLIVNKADNHPVYSGERSLRFELKGTYVRQI